MAKTVFERGSRVSKEWFNALQNIRFDDLDVDGHYDRLTDDALSNAPGNIKSEFYGFRDGLLVTHRDGLVIRVRAGSVTLQNGQAVSLPETFLTMPDSATRLVYVNTTGTLEVAGSAPTTGIILAEVRTSGGVVTSIKDLRPRLSYQVAPITVPQQATFVMPAGVFVPYGGTVAPSGWLMCDGSLLTVAQYPTLFAAIGNRWGGDGVQNFRIPNTADLTLRGASANRALGSTSGADSVTLVEGNMPPHRHPLSDPGHSHSVNDAGHIHTATDSGHSHNINDPGHDHNMKTLRGAALNSNPDDGTGAEASTQGSGGYFATNSSTTGISIRNASANISVANSRANVSVNASGTGVTMGITGGGLPFSVENRNLATNFIIKT